MTYKTMALVALLALPGCFAPLSVGHLATFGGTQLLRVLPKSDENPPAPGEDAPETVPAPARRQ